MSGPILDRRFSRQLLEDAIELRERLKANRKGDFADPETDIFQKLFRSLETSPCDVIDKLYAGDLFELFAQVSRIDPGGGCHFSE